MRKITQDVIALPAVKFMLDIFGFIPNRPQTDLAREGIRLLGLITGSDYRP